MINNDIIRSVRYMLNISESKLCHIIQLGEGQVSPAEVSAWLKKEDEEGFIECGHHLMSCFLNGLVYFKRGRDESRPPLGPELPTNNVVLKKLRVAFELKDEDVLNILNDTGVNVSKTEISAFFRKEGHKNYRPCGDQILRNFLKGLTNKVRFTGP